MNRAITVLLVEDHAIVRDILRHCLSLEEDIRVVGTAGDADQAITDTLRHKPDIIVFDIDMPGLLCFSAARTIKIRSPNSRIVFFSRLTNDYYIEQALAAHAWGYITKEQSLEDVVRAIRIVASGTMYFSPRIHARLLIDTNGVKLADDSPGPIAVLSRREREILHYIVRGLPNKRIARLINVTLKTVDKHCEHIMNKLNIHDRVELTRFAIREGLLDP